MDEALSISVIGLQSRGEITRKISSAGYLTAELSSLKNISLSFNYWGPDISS